MPALRKLWSRFPVRASFWFGLFALPWPGVPHAYGAILAAILNVVLGKDGPPVEVAFSGPGSEGGPWEVLTRVTESETGRSFQTGLDAHRTGYLPAAVFLALTLALAAPRRAKWRFLAGGLAALQLLSVLPFLAFLSGRLPIVAYPLGAPLRVTADVLYRALVAPLGMTYAVPVLLWLLLRQLSSARPDGAPAAPRAAGQPVGTRRGRGAPAAKRQRTGVTTR